jgi:hypothetical protein
MTWVRRACSPVCAGAADAISVSIRFYVRVRAVASNGAASGHRPRAGRPGARPAIWLIPCVGRAVYSVVILTKM